MPDKKLTDNEIKKALKEILEIMCVMGDLQKASTISNALDLINRLQEENERLKKEVAKEFTCFVGDPHKVEHCPYLEELQTAKAEAYKEFAFELKQISRETVYKYEIDNLLKERKDDDK